MKKMLFVYLFFFVLILSTHSLNGLSDQGSNNPEDMSKVLYINEMVNNYLSNESIISPETERIIKIIFKIKDEKRLNNQTLIILFCVFIGLLIIIQSILTLTPFFGKLTSWIAAIAIVLIINLSGEVYSFILFLLKITKVFEILEKENLLSLMFLLLLLFLIFYTSKTLTSIIRNEIKKDEAESLGERAGAAVKKLKVFDVNTE